jgi:hypothetical protein
MYKKVGPFVLNFDTIEITNIPKSYMKHYKLFQMAYHDDGSLASNNFLTHAKKPSLHGTAMFREWQKEDYSK